MKKVFVLAMAAMVMGSAVIAQTGDKDCCKKKSCCKKSCNKKDAKADAKTATPAPAPAK